MWLLLVDDDAVFLKLLEIEYLQNADFNVALNCMNHKAYDYVVKNEATFMHLKTILISIFNYNKMEKKLNHHTTTA